MSGRSRVEVGDCLETLRAMADASVDAVVTDPPYGLAFMGKKWDDDVPSVHVWAECLRVLKPGGHLLAFAGTRTQHRMAVRIEDAGFEIRDMIAWVYGSGFPKSMDVSKAIDKAAGIWRGRAGAVVGVNRSMSASNYERTSKGKPATDAAKRWEGWGTALKPAIEPITVARKPLVGTVAENVLKHGTGAINVDGCKVPTTDNLNGGAYSNGVKDLSKATSYATGVNVGKFVQPAGRWPSNLIHDGSDEVLAAFPQAPGQQTAVGPQYGDKASVNTFGDYGPRQHFAPRGDTGSAARFFYSPKALGEDRWDHNHHPTVKPVALMRYLCRLVTPPGGLVLDPFCGSGSTGVACVLEGFRFIGCEREAEYAAIARDRLGLAERPTTYVPAHAPKLAAAEPPPLFAPTESTP